MEAGVDRRIRKTREALHAALMSLIVERGYDAITVEDILVAADVGRSTFYAHFAGKDALLAFGFERLRAELAGSVDGSAPEPFGFLPALLAHVRRHAGLYRGLLEGRGDMIVHRQFRAILDEYVAADLKRRSTPAADLALQASFYCGGILAVIEAWLASSRPASVERINRLLGDLLAAP